MSALHDKTKLAIRDEVERRFELPPAKLLKIIEEEVEIRVERRVKYYRTMLFIFGAFFSIVAAVFWERSEDNISKRIETELSAEPIIQAKRMIIAASNDVFNTAQTVFATGADAEVFKSRLAAISQQDNVLLADDFASLYVTEFVTNYDGGRILLKYDPIPQTIRFVHVDYTNFSAFYQSPNLNPVIDNINNAPKYVVGRTLILDPMARENLFIHKIHRPFFRINYVRKSHLPR
jgi:hypothetical protein